MDSPQKEVTDTVEIAQSMRKDALCSCRIRKELDRIIRVGRNWGSYPKIVTPKELPPTAGPSRDLTQEDCPTVDGEDAVKPLKAMHCQARMQRPDTKVAGSVTLGGYRNNLHTRTEIDSELLAVLQLEAMFVDRTPALLLRLKAKGIAYLKKFDLGRYTQADLNTQLTRAIAAAMDISFEEQVALDRLSNTEEAFQRHRLNDLTYTGSAPEASNVALAALQGKMSHLPVGKPKGGLLSVVAKAGLSRAVGTPMAEEIMDAVDINAVADTTRSFKNKISGVFRRQSGTC